MVETGAGRTPARRLVVVRHARAEPAASSDRARELSPEGRVDAAAAGRWLAGRGVEPDVALVSAATRTDQTWQHLADGAGWTTTPRLEQALYEASSATVIDLLRGCDETAACAVVVGHNPVMAALAQLLDDGEGDVEAGNEMAMGFPTCAVAVFDVEVAWADLAHGTARLTGFHVGRG